MKISATMPHNQGKLEIALEQKRNVSKEKCKANEGRSKEGEATILIAVRLLQKRRRKRTRIEARH